MTKVSSTSKRFLSGTPRSLRRSDVKLWTGYSNGSAKRGEVLLMTRSIQTNDSSSGFAIFHPQRNSLTKPALLFLSQFTFSPLPSHPGFGGVTV
mmetsp:Transcript_22192/g.28319  ORF Transcript_22192/g.28319 Transcript_22192/m.28319 type:complete len:94 (-) Transcript_22192:65-346(-)